MNCVFSCGHTLDVATNGLHSLLVWETYNVETKVLLLVGSPLVPTEMFKTSLSTISSRIGLAFFSSAIGMPAGWREHVSKPNNPGLVRARYQAQQQSTELYYNHYVDFRSAADREMRPSKK